MWLDSPPVLGVIAQSNNSSHTPMLHWFLKKGTLSGQKASSMILTVNERTQFAQLRFHLGRVIVVQHELSGRCSRYLLS